MHILKLILFVCMAVPILMAQSKITDPMSQRLCAEAKNTELPAEDRPTPDESKALANCVSEDLYFGFGRPADPVTARKCAYAEMDRGETRTFSGKAILTMVYANGKGANRNLDVAIKLACELNGAPDDLAGTIRQLARYKQAHWTGNSFTVCDHSAARFMYEQCAILDDRFDSLARRKKIEAITSKWSAADQKAFQSLQQVAEKFFQLHAGKERDLNGTVLVHEQAFMERQFIEMLETLERGELPDFSPEAARKADADMNAAYSAVVNGSTKEWGTVTVEGIRQTQQAWLPYRDAWVQFGKKKYPKVTPESWKAWITQQRIPMLEWFVKPSS
ncbi:MAG: DUF1311 domain-containing protein [Candidatus Angelobacter sp. Gp1-AA117]|nr:MAG: DUF1311 domain-containing protein [Candidatus Angelobacter sp. Gp1-AA117]